MAGIGGHHSTHAATHDWITPQYVLDALGRFDLDPCASLTQPWPPAYRKRGRPPFDASAA